MQTLPGRTTDRRPHISLSRYGVHRASEVTAEAVSLCRIPVRTAEDLLPGIGVPTFTSRASLLLLESIFSIYTLRE
jgi:hypothetical protein